MIGAAYRASGPVMDQPVHGRIDSIYGLISISLIGKWSEAGKRRTALLEETETGANIRPGTTERCYFYRLGYKLRPHRMLAAPVREAGNGGQGPDRPQQLVAAQPEMNPKWILCRSQSMGKVRISRASERPAGSSPLRIASMISGASVVSFRMRTT